MHDDPRIHASVEKELLNAERFYDNLCRTGPWRYAAILKNSRYCREALDKAFALQGNTGRWIFDLWVYIVQALPWFLPATSFLIPGLFAGLVGLISSAFSVVTKEPKVIEKTITVPILWIFKVTKTISETVWVPVVHAPDIRIATGLAVTIVICGLLLLSCLLKFAFKAELKYRMNLMRRAVSHAEPDDPSNTERSA